MEERDVCRCVHLRANVKLETLKEISLKGLVQSLFEASRV